MRNKIYKWLWVRMPNHFENRLPPKNLNTDEILNRLAKNKHHQMIMEMLVD